VSILDGKAAWRLHDGSSAAILIDGCDYYRAFYQAASSARRSILLLGWQFDSDVLLLRGEDVPDGADPKDYTMLRFLDRLCRERPELEVRILAWDHSFVFALERELLQKVVFDVTTNERLQFRTDDTVPLGGSHHQKVAIIDGRIAFVGSQDLCQARWDDSAHCADNPLRTSRFGIAYKPYHEVQVCLTGLPVRSLVELFVDRWRDATGEELEPSSLVAAYGASADRIDVSTTLPMPAASVALSRTMPEIEGREGVREIQALLVRAIQNAERFIYMETQYLTSCAMRDALAARMADHSRPPLDIVLVLPRKPEKLKEELTIGPPQAVMLETLANVARENGHALGMYNVVAPSPDSEDVYVYIHAKLMIVDDRFMTIGSANFTNRSMTIDSELNVSWEAAPADRRLHAAIRRARVRLLLEHTGGAARVRELVSGRGLVARLDALADTVGGRLRHHPIEHEEPSVIARAVQDLACEYLDPEPHSRPSAA
jgi:phospholipase D1/2